MPGSDALYWLVPAEADRINPRRRQHSVNWGQFEEHPPTDFQHRLFTHPLD